MWPEVDGDRREVIIADRRVGGGKGRPGSVDALDGGAAGKRLRPRIKQGPLADPADRKGVGATVYRHSLQIWACIPRCRPGHPPNAPIAKTGAAVRALGLAAARNIRDHLVGRSLSGAHYDGYAACPFTTSRNRMLLAEFDYTGHPRLTIPFINTQRKRYDTRARRSLKRCNCPPFFDPGISRR